MSRKDSNNQKKETTFKELILTFSLAVIIVLLMQNFVVGFALVKGPSMENTIQEGDRIIYSKLFKPKKGDIVIVKTDQDVKIIKRVIATEGDKVKFVEGELYVNDKIMKEPYIKEHMDTLNIEEITIPKGEIYVLGDNRNASQDSRYYGSFNIKETYKGKVLYEIWNTPQKL